MHIEFKSLKIKNFRSIREAELLFVPGLHLIVGLNQVDEFSVSNGSGKSTLLPYAIPYALYGRFRSPDGKIIRSGFKRRQVEAELCSCELTLETDNKIVNITRGRRGSKPFLTVEGSPTPIKGDQELSSIVGCDFSTLTSLLVLTRASVEGGLFYGTDTKRKEFFLSLAGIDELIARSTEILKANKSEVSLNSLELRTMYDVEFKHANVESEIQRITSLLEDIKSKIVNATLVVGQYSDKYNELIQTQSELTKILDSENSKIGKYEEAQSKIASYNEVFEKRGSLQSSISYLRTRISELDVQSQSARNLKGVCINCYQEIPAAHVQRIIDNIIATKIPFLEQVTQREQELNAIGTEIREIDNLKVRLNELLSSARTKRDQALRDKATTESEISKLSFEYQSNLKILDEYDPWRTSLEAQLSELCGKQLRSIARLDSLKADALCFYNLEQACNSWLTFLKSTLPAYALTEMTAYMSVFVDRCIKVLWDSRISINIHFDKASEDLIIQIKDNIQEEITIASLSAGEQARVFLSLALGAIIATRSFRGWSSNLFILDEVFDMLDQVGREVVYNLLYDLARQFNLCCYVISHHSHPAGVVADSILRLVKDVNGSILVKE